MAPKVGKRYRLKASVGNEAQGFHLQPGWIATVEEILPAGTAGVQAEGGVVLSFPTATANIGPDGEVEVIKSARRWPCPHEQFDELFEPVKENGK